MTTKERSRRIAIDARSYASSSGAYVRNLIAQIQLLDSKHEYDIYVPDGVAAELQVTNPNMRVRTSSANAYSPAEQINFLFQLMRKRYDLVHFAMQQQPALYARPHVTTFHDLTIVSHDTLNKGRFVNTAFRTVASTLFRITLRTSRIVIVPSQATARAVKKFAKLQDDKIVVTPEAADVTDGGLTPYDVAQPQYILYVGNFYEYKNVARLVEAHQLLLKQFPDLGLVLVGRFHRAARELVERIENSGYKNITLTGFIDESQRNWLYANCAAYVFPSLSEGFGLPALEAMSFGAPVVAAHATSLPEVCGDAAHYFDPLDVSDMAAQIGAVISSESLRNKMRAQNAVVLGDYSWQRMAQQTLDAYERALTPERKA